MSRRSTAARLARRELLRHRWRSLLVVAMVAIPVALAQSAIVWVISDDGWVDVDREDPAVRAWGGEPDETVPVGADTDIPPTGGAPAHVEEGFVLDDWVDSLPGEGTGVDDLSAVQVKEIHSRVTGIELVDGRLPRSRTEALIDEHLAGAIGVGPGENLRLLGSGVDLTVTGIVQGHGGPSPTMVTYSSAASEANMPSPVRVGRIAVESSADDWVPQALAQVGDGTGTWVGGSRIVSKWFDPLPVDNTRPPPDYLPMPTARIDESRGTDAIIATVAATIGVGFVAICCSTAFAIGARRQLRDLGVLACAGAAPADLRRTVVLQGAVLGAVGGIAGTALTATLRSGANRWWLTPYESPGHLLWPWAPVVAIAVLGLVAGTVAAVAPAVTASRVPVLSALAGRRPERRRPLRLPWLAPPLGGIGLGLLSHGTANRYQPEIVAVAAGVLLVMAAAVAVAPGLVALTGPLSRRNAGTTRLASRNLGRARMRTAAVVAAIAMAVGLPTVAVTWNARDLLHGVEEHYDEAGRVTPTASEDAWRRAVAQTDVAEVAIETESDGPDASVDTDRLSDRANEVIDILGPRNLTAAFDDGLLVVDPSDLRRLGETWLADQLDAGRVVSAPWPPARRVAPQGAEAPGLTTGDDVIASTGQVGPLGRALLSGHPGSDYLRSRRRSSVVSGDPMATARRNGGLRVLRETPLTRSETELLHLVQTEVSPSRADVEDNVTRPIPVWLQFDPGREGSTVPLGLVTLGVALLVTLTVTAAAQGLAAADGRPDDAVVRAVGAPPSSLRRRRVTEAALTIGAACLLGIVTAAVATLTVIHNPGITREFDVTRPALQVPFAALAGIGLVVMVAVVGGTWLVLAISDRLGARRDLVLTDS